MLSTTPSSTMRALHHSPLHHAPIHHSPLHHSSLHHACSSPLPPPPCVLFTTASTMRALHHSLHSTTPHFTSPHSPLHHSPLRHSPLRHSPFYHSTTHHAPRCSSVACLGVFPPSSWRTLSAHYSNSPLTIHNFQFSLKGSRDYGKYFDSYVRFIVLSAQERNKEMCNHGNKYTYKFCVHKKKHII